MAAALPTTQRRRERGLAERAGHHSEPLKHRLVDGDFQDCGIRILAVERGKASLDVVVVARQAAFFQQDVEGKWRRHGYRPNPNGIAMVIRLRLVKLCRSPDSIRIFRLSGLKVGCGWSGASLWPAVSRVISPVGT